MRGGFLEDFQFGCHKQELLQLVVWAKNVDNRMVDGGKNRNYNPQQLHSCSIPPSVMCLSDQ